MVQHLASSSYSNNEIVVIFSSETTRLLDLNIFMWLPYDKVYNFNRIVLIRIGIQIQIFFFKLCLTWGDLHGAVLYIFINFSETNDTKYLNKIQVYVSDQGPST